MNYHRNIKITGTIQNPINKNTKNQQRQVYIINCISWLSLKLRKLLYEPPPKYENHISHSKPQLIKIHRITRDTPIS